MKDSRMKNGTIFVLMSIVAIAFLLPMLIVLMNSFKGKLYISDAPFVLPNTKTFVGLDNYTSGVKSIGFFKAAGYSLFITVSSVFVLIFGTSMTAWYITRVKAKYTTAIYYMLAFAMVVPFQMVMFPTVKIANMLHLDNPLGIIIIYLGFGAAVPTFTFAGFIKTVPMEIEEAAEIDGCNPIQTFFRVVFPVLKPTTISVAILQTMWIWNDYLLPYLLIGSEYRTIPIAIQYLQQGYGSIDMGAMMAVLVLAIIPIVVFYFVCQKYIIEGVVAGAVKG